MAVSAIQKAYFFVHSNQLTRLMELLQKMEVLHLEKVVDFDAEVSAHVEQFTPNHEGIDDVLRAISDLGFAIKFLKQFEGKLPFVQNLLTTFMGEKMVLSQEQFNSLMHSIDYHQVLDHVKFLDSKLQSIKEEKKSCIDAIDALLPWEALAVPLGELAAGNDVQYMLATFKEPDYVSFSERIGDDSDLLVLEDVNKSKQKRWVFMAHHRVISSQIATLIKESGGEISQFPQYRKKSIEEIKELRKRVKELDRLEKELLQEASSLYKYRKSLMVLFDHYQTQHDRYQASQSLSGTEETVLVSGWIPKQFTKELSAAIEKEIEEVSVSFTDPEPDDDIPIVLKNNFFDSPFEAVIKMYGMPDKKEVDPTPFVAPVFAFFFGICLTDAGYGILLMFASALLLKYMRLGPDPRKFFKLFLFGGCFAFLCGLVTGGWFGISFEKLPLFLQKCVLLKPLDNPVTFLFICLAIGFVHLLLGLFLGFLQLLREKRPVEAIAQKLSWIVILIMIVVFAYGKTKGLSGGVVVMAKWSILIALGVVLLFAGHGAKNIFVRLGQGGFEIYNAIGFLGDTLSYSRLMALGLATGCIAMVINMIAGMLLQIPIPVLNVVIVVLFLIVGHIGNIAINTLGGFVHTARLQFLEFFKQFFIGGGRVFRPFKRQGKFVFVDSGEKEK